MDHCGFPGFGFGGSPIMASYGDAGATGGLGNLRRSKAADGVGRGVGAGCNSDFAGGAGFGPVRTAAIDLADCGWVHRLRAVLALQQYALGRNHYVGPFASLRMTWVIWIRDEMRLRCGGAFFLDKFWF